MKKNIYFLIALCLLAGCRSVTVPMQSGGEQSFRSVEQYFEESPVLQSYFVGFQLYDLEENEVLYQKNEDKYFTPASNTKLLTLYTSLLYLQDSIAWMNVYNVDGEIVYQPQADPSFLHPDIETEDRIKNFFADLPEPTISFATNHMKDKRLGAGWAWDDFDSYYQTEKSPFPIQSNLMGYRQKEVWPVWLPAEIYFDQSEAKPFARDEVDNRFYLPGDEPENEFVPFHYNQGVLRNFFVSQGKLYREYTDSLSEENLVKTIYSQPADSVYKVLMKNSDNHIAEQLLLNVSQQQLGKMQTRAIIEKAKTELFTDISEEINWADGSGLSRYNLFTPRAMVWTVNHIIEEKGIDWITTIFPSGGESGTIRNLYAFEDGPRVFAKTGTLRNNHCLSGIVQAKSGKWYSFSFMNNHYPGSSTTAKKEMDNVLRLIVELY